MALSRGLKAASLCAISALLGAVAAHLVLSSLWDAPPAPREPSSAGGASADAVPDAEAASAGVELDSPFADARLARYLRAAQLAAPRALETEIERAAGLPRSHAADSELQTLLLRYVELDPERAVAFARSLALDRAFIVAIFEAWASLDRAAAFAALEAMNARDLTVAVAVTLVGDTEDIERLASLVGADDRDAFRSAALARFAESDPQAALSYALALDERALRARSNAQRIAGEWAKRDPVGAIAYVSATVDDARLRNGMLISVIGEWARVDPDRALEYLSSPDGRELTFVQSGAVVSALTALAIRRPEAALTAADALARDVRAIVRAAALRNIVDADLDAAVVRIDAMPVGAEREELVRIVATTFARRDPRGAFAWAQRLERSSPGITNRVVLDIARNDLPAAVELVLAMPDGSRTLAQLMSPMPPPFGTPITMNAGSLQAVADTLVAAGAAQGEAMANLLQAWPQMDPDAALTWMLEQDASLDLRHLKGLAAGFVRGDVALSKELLDTLPPESRGVWITEVASFYAVSDVEAALTWLARFRAEPGYDDWVSSAAASATMFPSAAGALLATARRPAPDLTARVASSWAMRDSPRAAAEWARNLSDPEARSAGVAAAARAWTARDRSAAQTWVLSLRDGELRDRALGAVLSQDIETHGAIEPRVLNAFSSVAVLRSALEDAVAAFGRLNDRDPERARALRDAYVDVPELRDRIEDTIGP